MDYNLNSRKKPGVYFISGVCGTGKSATLKHFKELLSQTEYDIRDFDEKGVPDGGGPEWHNAETLYWLETAMANAAQMKSTIICGFANPETFKTVYKQERHPPALIFLLNASADVLQKRLLGRYQTSESIEEINRAAGKPLDEFIMDNILFAPEFKIIFEKENLPVIETDNKTPAEVAKEIVDYLL